MATIPSPGCASMLHCDRDLTLVGVLQADPTLVGVLQAAPMH